MKFGPINDAKSHICIPSLNNVKCPICIVPLQKQHWTTDHLPYAKILNCLVPMAKINDSVEITVKISNCEVKIKLSPNSVIGNHAKKKLVTWHFIVELRFVSHLQTLVLVNICYLLLSICYFYKLF